MLLNGTETVPWRIPEHKFFAIKIAGELSGK